MSVCTHQNCGARREGDHFACAKRDCPNPDMRAFLYPRLATTATFRPNWAGAAQRVGQEIVFVNSYVAREWTGYPEWEPSDVMVMPGSTGRVTELHDDGVTCEVRDSSGNLRVVRVSNEEAADRAVWLGR